MADWYGHARSNYFRVKDEQAFRDAVKNLDIEIVEENGAGRFALLANGDKGDWPSCRYDEDTDDYVDIDIVDLIAEHLADGEVAVLMECGAEKLRYLTGWAIALNNKGEHRRVGLEDIYEQARELGPNVTEAEY
jgi:hypothetical protein